MAIRAFPNSSRSDSALYPSAVGKTAVCARVRTGAVFPLKPPQKGCPQNTHPVWSWLRHPAHLQRCWASGLETWKPSRDRSSRTFDFCACVTSCKPPPKCVPVSKGLRLLWQSCGMRISSECQPQCEPHWCNKGRHFVLSVCCRNSLGILRVKHVDAWQYLQRWELGRTWGTIPIRGIRLKIK